MTPFTLRPAATPIAWEIIKGDEFDILVSVLDDDNVAVDLTGWTAKAQVRRSEAEPVLHEWSATENNISCDEHGVTLSIIGAQTSQWGWAKARISIEVYAPVTSKPHVIAEGTISALPETTQ